MKRSGSAPVAVLLGTFVALPKRLMKLGVLLLALLTGISAGAQANVTGTWTATANGGSAVANGATVTLTLSATGSPVPVADTMNSTNYWTNPYTGGATNSRPSLFFLIPPGGATATITFSKPVDNPVIHFDRLGGTVSGLANSSEWTLSAWYEPG